MRKKRTTLNKVGSEKITQFEEMGLDVQILKAIARLGWSEPTQIQEKAIPLALDGKDILSRACTGSGKTATYSIPIIQKLLQKKKMSNKTLAQEVRALVVVFSRELSQQTHKMIKELTSYCSKDIKSVDLCVEPDPRLIRPLLALKPDIVIGTPGRILANIEAGNLSSLNSLEWLVMDGVDLLFSFGYEADFKNLLPHFPNSCQTFLMTASFSDDIEPLKKLVLRNPVTLNLLGNESLAQYHIFCDEEGDKYLLIYTLIKLQFVKGKTLLFVNSITRSYRLKLFLEQFSLSCCVLNSELPVNTRCHVVEQYNKGIYKYLIATDNSLVIAEPKYKKEEEETKKGKSKKQRKAKMKEHDALSEVDFQEVSNVINFDFPLSVRSYIHRAGRTDNTGTVLSFVMTEELKLLEETQKASSDGGDHVENLLKPYQFKMAEMERFRRRCMNAIRAVTKEAIIKARVKDLRTEILNSTKLKTREESPNPNDLIALRHDPVLKPIKVKSHKKNVPEYRIPPTSKAKYTETQTAPKRTQQPPPSHDVKASKRKKLGVSDSKYRKNSKAQSSTA